jgi:hypothetical protein
MVGRESRSGLDDRGNSRSSGNEYFLAGCKGRDRHDAIPGSVAMWQRDVDDFPNSDTQPTRLWSRDLGTYQLSHTYLLSYLNLFHNLTKPNLTTPSIHLPNPKDPQILNGPSLPSQAGERP